MMKKGFTLSEVLITLSIVGVVAVLTIPGVVKNYKNRLYVSQLQKVTSQIENATRSIMNDEHVDNFLETKVLLDKVIVDEIEMTGWEYFMTKYFKTSKINCGNGNEQNPCIAKGSVGTTIDLDAYHSISGAKAGYMNGYCIQTVNGAAICANYNPANLTTTIFIDVNGSAEPNIAGRDAFVVNIDNDGSIYDPSVGSQCNKSKSGWGNLVAKYAAGCYQNIVDAGWKMEY